MPRPESTEIIIRENGDEEHPSWLLLRANHVSSSPGARLFDSEIQHRHYIEVTVSRCTRKRDLNYDWLHSTQTLIEIDMSQAQWGAFVSSFGNGNGVPATLAWFDGKAIPGVATNDSRLDKSHQEVKGAADRAMKSVQEAHAVVQEAFEGGAGKREMRALLRTLQIKMDNLPANLEFAAKSLTEHVENVVVKARSDIEGMAYQAYKNGTALESGDPIAKMLGSGDED